MKLEHENSTTVRQTLHELFSRYLDLSRYKVFFFGSRVRGTNSEVADIDVGIAGPEAVPLETMAEIKDEVDALPILYKIDVVDMATVSSAFREQALSYTEPLAA